jgi:hypothetical protein
MVHVAELVRELGLNEMVEHLLPTKVLQTCNVPMLSVHLKQELLDLAIESIRLDDNRCPIPFLLHYLLQAHIEVRKEKLQRIKFVLETRIFW